MQVEENRGSEQARATPDEDTTGRLTRRTEPQGAVPQEVQAVRG